jgi:hypothetical protein
LLFGLNGVRDGFKGLGEVFNEWDKGGFVFLFCFAWVCDFGRK